MAVHPWHARVAMHAAQLRSSPHAEHVPALRKPQPSRYAEGPHGAQLVHSLLHSPAVLLYAPAGQASASSPHSLTVELLTDTRGPMPTHCLL